MKRALIVDDKDENLYLLRVLLQSNGWDVHEAHHGAEALIKARQRRPNLIVSDLLMPIMDGYTLLRYLRADQTLSDVPFIVYTATYGEPADERLAMEMGADAFVLKPTEPEVFLRRIQEVVSSGTRKNRETPPRVVPAPSVMAFSDDPHERMLAEYNQILVRKLEEKSLQLMRTNRELLERDRQLSALIANFPGVAYRCRNDGQYTTEFVSDGVIAMTGHSPTDFLEQRVNLSKLICEEDRDAVRTAIQQALREDRPWEVTYRILHADGQARWWWERGAGVQDTAAAGPMLEGFVIDITDRKRADAALRDSEERFQLALDAARMGTWDWDLASGKIIWSRVHEELWDLTAGAYGGTFAEFEARVHPDDRSMLKQAIESALASRMRYNAEYRLVRADQSIRWIAGLGQACYNELGEPIRMTGIVMDITDRRAIEAERTAAAEQLKVSEARSRAILDSMLAFVGLISLDGILLDTNRAPLDAAAIDKSDVIGRKVEDTVWLNHSTQTQEQVRSAVARAALGETVREDFDLRVANDAHIVLDTVFAPIYDANGKVVQVVASGVDVTDRKLAEAGRQRLEAQLWQAQKMEALGTLAGGVAHDFNNILSAIAGNVELARQDVPADHAALTSLNEIRKASQRAKFLVQQILAFSRKQASERRIIALQPLVEECAAMLRATLPASVELKVKCERDVPPVLADATQIHQVLLNLGTNAWHALAHATGQIEMHLGATTIASDLAHQFANLHAGRYAVIAVNDTGVGMDETVLGRIFEPFYTTKRVGQGTGLGLSVVDGIVKGHDGAIRVESTPGRGSTFTLYFPVIDISTTHPAPAPASATERGAGQHILYLDDDEALVSVTVKTLERAGYRATGFYRPTEALDALRADPQRFDLVVTDFTMPGTSGIQVTRLIRQLAPKLPVILMSGYVTDDLKQRANEVGIRQVMHKPYNHSELHEALQNALMERRHAAER